MHLLTIELVQGINKPKENTPRITPPIAPKKLREACKLINFKLGTIVN